MREGAKKPDWGGLEYHAREVDSSFQALGRWSGKLCFGRWHQEEWKGYSLFSYFVPVTHSWTLESNQIPLGAVSS